MVIIEKKTFKVRRKTNYGFILWLIVIVSFVIGFLVASNYSDNLRLKETEEKETEEEQSRNGGGRKKSRTKERKKNNSGVKKPIKKKGSEENSREKVNNKSSDNKDVGKNVTDGVEAETIFDADEEEIDGERQEEVVGGSEKTSEENREKSQNNEEETTDDEIKSEKESENSEEGIVNTEIEDDKIIEELKTKISTNSPEQYQKIENKISSFKDQIEDWDRSQLEHERNLFVKSKKQVRERLMQSDVQSNEEWRKQLEEGLLEKELEVREIEDRLSKLPND